jgi:hypothetical protein
VWVERSGGSIEYVDEIQRIWPAARLVYLVRDGRDCAYSMSQHPMFRIRLARILSRNPSLDPRTALNSHIPLDRFGAYWSALMQRVERSLASTTPRNRLVLSYEDLITDVATQLRRLSTFLELDESAVRRWTQLARDVVRPSTSRWQGLTAPERSTLERACRPGLRALERVLSRYGV